MAIALTKRQIKEMGIEYVIGAAHWPMYVPMESEAVMRDFHRQNMFLATHPLVTIVGHPWWWHGHWRDADGGYHTDPWLDDFRRVPASMHEELAAAAIEHGKVVEINLEAMLLNAGYLESFKRQYLEFAAWLKGRGVRLCLGSDCHDENYAIGFDRGARMLESVGIGEEDLWVLPARR